MCAIQPQGAAGQQEITRLQTSTVEIQCPRLHVHQVGVIEGHAGAAHPELRRPSTTLLEDPLVRDSIRPPDTVTIQRT